VYTKGLALILLAISLVAAIPSPRTTNHVNRTERSDEYTEQKDGAPTPRSIATPQFRADKPTYGTEHYAYNVYEYSQPSDLWTIIVGIATAVMAVFSIALWWTSRKQWAVAKQALKVAESALVVARVKFPIHNLSTGQQPWVQVDLINIGKSPAYHSTYQTWADILGYPFSDFLPTSTRVTSPMESIIYPGTEVVHEVPIRHLRHVSVQEHHDLGTQKARFYFRIRVDYEDRFGDPHFTDTCWASDGSGIEPCAKYNDCK
jgi:hypothetical protein